MTLLRFMAGPAGRLLRAALGLAMMLVGLFLVGGAGGAVLTALGALPLLAGALNFCLAAPLLGAPLSGWRVLDGR